MWDRTGVTGSAIVGQSLPTYWVISTQFYTAVHAITLLPKLG